MVMNSTDFPMKSREKQYNNTVDFAAIAYAITQSNLLLRILGYKPLRYRDVRDKIEKKYLPYWS
jgi:hypothetical protein